MIKIQKRKEKKNAWMPKWATSLRNWLVTSAHLSLPTLWICAADFLPNSYCPWSYQGRRRCLDMIFTALAGACRRPSQSPAYAVCSLTQRLGINQPGDICCCLILCPGTRYESATSWLYMLMSMVYQSGERFGTPNPFFLSLPAFLFFFIE